MRGVLQVVVAGFVGQAAMAQDVSVAAGVGLEFTNETHDGVTSEASAYVEGSLSGFYLGAAAYLYNDTDANEIDLSLGFRNTLASGLSYDASYTRYLYPADGGDCCGAVALSLSLPVGASLTATVDATYYDQDDTNDSYLTLNYALNDTITLTGSVGRYSNVGFADTREWELAASYALGEASTASVHYYDGSDYKGYIGINLNWDTTLLGG